MTGGVESINSFVGNYGGWNYLKLCAFGAMKNSGRADIPNNAKPVRAAVCLMMVTQGSLWLLPAMAGFFMAAWREIFVK